MIGDNAFDLVLSDECPDPRFGWRLVVEFEDLLRRYGFTATELQDPDMAAIERELHGLIFGRSCEGGHR